MSPPAIDTDVIDGLADADDAEAAAIAVAIAAHLQEQEAAAAAAAAGDSDGSGSRRSWEFAGRLAGVGITAKRPPVSTPTDDWTAADRADRF